MAKITAKRKGVKFLVSYRNHLPNSPGKSGMSASKTLTNKRGCLWMLTLFSINSMDHEKPELLLAHFIKFLLCAE